MIFDTTRSVFDSYLLARILRGRQQLALSRFLGWSQLWTKPWESKNDRTLRLILDLRFQALVGLKVLIFVDDPCQCHTNIRRQSGAVLFCSEKNTTDWLTGIPEWCRDACVHAFHFGLITLRSRTTVFCIRSTCLLRLRCSFLVHAFQMPVVFTCLRVACQQFSPMQSVVRNYSSFSLGFFELGGRFVVIDITFLFALCSCS